MILDVDRQCRSVFFDYSGVDYVGGEKRCRAEKNQKRRPVLHLFRVGDCVRALIVAFFLEANKAIATGVSTCRGNVCWSGDHNSVDNVWRRRG